jgi:rhodanese-related sulfurtransferase
MWNRTTHKLTPIDPESFVDYTGNFDRISAATFCALVDNHPNFDNVFVCDCRTPGEYNGGHIKTAIRCHPFMESIPDLYKAEYNAKISFIFHCEFSAYRAPAAIVQFQNTHRAAGRPANELHAFVLDGGFSQFHPEHKDYCIGNYVPEMACLTQFYR